MKKTLLSALTASAILLSQPLLAADYVIDVKGKHASINFKVSHLGYSFVVGRFNEFDGTLSYDADKPEQAKISVSINPASVDTNHETRDKHLRGEKFLAVDQYKDASFSSTSVQVNDNGQLAITGNLTLMGQTKPVTIQVDKVGEGNDPWGGYRVGFVGKTAIAMKDWGFKSDFGQVEFELHIEAIRQ